MKKLLLLSAIITLSMSVLAQAKGQNRGKTHNDNRKTSAQNANHQTGKNSGRTDVYETPRNTTTKYSKNTPAKVSESFMHDYPNATNVTWTKNRGYWVATFSDGLYRTSVRYAANGERTNTTRRRTRL